MSDIFDLIDISNGNLKGRIDQMIESGSIDQHEAIALILAVNRDAMTERRLIRKAMEEMKVEQNKYRPITYLWAHHKAQVLIVFIGISAIYISDSREFILTLIGSLLKMVF